MAQYTLDQATNLTQLDDGTFLSPDGAAYWNFRSAFGGWALALAFEAARAARPGLPLLASTTAHFMKPLPEHGLALAVRLMRTGRRTDFLRVEGFAQEDRQAPLFAVDFVFSNAQDGALDYTAACPTVAAPEECDVLPTTPGPRWLANYEQRLALGKPFSAQERPRSVAWVRDASGRPWDEKAILALSDTPMPRTFFLDPAPRFSSTVTYGLHLMCTRAELEQLGSGFLLVETDAPRVARGRFTQDVRVWSPTGQLLAVSNQLAFY
ncbi:acyl-CoA thioesterase II [Erythrobacter sp. CCH5-A1]|uniref:acyl-CoA thioesterase n=1 Tax=Erythrobacter sp. CCH5-A1 TaxID=1768792 RepID=UPI000833E1CF|nr:thioesterase family protein [Erythrobacter sp. CCH5-A1]